MFQWIDEQQAIKEGAKVVDSCSMKELHRIIDTYSKNSEEMTVAEYDQFRKQCKRVREGA